MGVYRRHIGGLWSGNIKLNHGIKIIKCYEAICKNIAPHKILYLYLTVIFIMKHVYDVFKENNHRDGLNFIENNPNWTNVNRGISCFLLLIQRCKDKLIKLLKKNPSYVSK